MTGIKLSRLSDTVGAEVVDVDRDRLLTDPDLPGEVMTALDEVGVLVFPKLDLDPEAQAAFCRRIGPLETQLTKSHSVEGVTRITLDRSKTAMADYLMGNFGWHIDGCTPHGDEYPPMVTMLTAQIVAEGANTEFASTYAAYDNLADDEKQTFVGYRVLHSFESAVLPFLDDPQPEQIARLRAQPTKVHPLVWEHESGRRSLVIGTHAKEIVGLPADQGAALLSELLERATQPDRIYRHEWATGDTVLWDNRGLVHRVARYDTSEPREMFRTTVLGQEPIQLGSVGPGSQASAS